MKPVVHERRPQIIAAFDNILSLTRFDGPELSAYVETLMFGDAQRGLNPGYCVDADAVGQPLFLHRVESLLAQINRELKQVLIEAKILEVTLTAGESFGIDCSNLFKTVQLRQQGRELYRSSIDHPARRGFHQ